jgi:hypothetical protein
MPNPTANGGDLATVVDQFVAEMDEIESIFARCKGDRTVQGVSFTYIPTEDGCLVSLWDAWNRFLRRLVLSSARGPTLGLSGIEYVPVTQRSEADALLYLHQHRKGRNFGIVNGEPKWFNLPCLTDIVSALGLGNGVTIVSAVTATTVQLGPITIPSPLEEIRICRNYVAHKCKPTLGDVAAACPNPFHGFPDHLRRPRSGVETFSEWVEAMTALAEAAAQ